jgi:hypothetical protein
MRFVEKIAPAVAQAKTYAKPDDIIDSAIKENVQQSAKDVQPTAKSCATRSCR